MPCKLEQIAHERYRPGLCPQSGKAVDDMHRKVSMQRAAFLSGAIHVVESARQYCDDIADDGQLRLGDTKRARDLLLHLISLGIEQVGRPVDQREVERQADEGDRHFWNESHQEYWERRVNQCGPYEPDELLSAVKLQSEMAFQDGYHRAICEIVAWATKHGHRYMQAASTNDKTIKVSELRAEFLPESA